MNVRLSDFLLFLYRRSPGRMIVVACVSLLSGVCSAGVLALINRALQGNREDTWHLGIGFAVCVLGKLVTRVHSQMMLARMSQDTMYDLTFCLCGKIVASPFRQAETQGPARVMTVLNDDIGALGWSIQSLPQLMTNIAIVIVCGGYLAWLSWTAFLSIVGVTILGISGYQWFHMRTFSDMRASREARTHLYEHFRALTDGLKELLMHPERRQEFLDHEVRRAAELYRCTNIEAAKKHAVKESWSHVAFYLMIGSIIFVFPSLFSLSPESLIGYTVVMLYMMSPIWGIVGALPPLERGLIAYDHILKFERALDEVSYDVGSVPLSGRRSAATVILDQVMFTYSDPEKRMEPFSLGPINLTIRPGELVFIVGGNGSGKSTFVKMLAGLYVPHHGDIYVSGVKIVQENREWYRTHYSIVFSDFYLFQKLFGIEGEDVDSLAREQLASLQLDHKVEVKDRQYSTIDLSQGQRKRLALVTAYLENRPIYVFDEWAADQDPQYKEIFYRKLLPDLRSRGKSVIVITHDDRYFELGDRVVKLEEGKIVESWTPQHGVAKI